MGQPTSLCHHLVFLMSYEGQVKMSWCVGNLNPFLQKEWVKWIGLMSLIHFAPSTNPILYIKKLLKSWREILILGFFTWIVEGKGEQVYSKRAQHFFYCVWCVWKTRVITVFG